MRIPECRTASRKLRLLLKLSGLFLLLKPLGTEGCSANQHSTASVTASNDLRALQNGTILTLPLNSSCRWGITAPEGKVVRTTVIVVNFTLSCDEEYLRIYDGPGKSSEVLKEYCQNSSNQTHSTFYSSGRSVLVETKKGLINSTSGSIMVIYRAVPGCRENRHMSANLIAGEDERTLQDGSFGLPLNSSCQWNITAPEGKVIKIDVSAYYFELPCNEEYLRIRDGPGQSSKILTEYCLNASINGYREEFFSSGRSLWIETKQGKVNYSTYARVRVYYQAIDMEECSVNSTLDAPLWPTEHNFSTPYYPDGYPMNKTCGWYITAPTNRAAVVHIKYKLTTAKDTVEVYDADGSELTLISVFKGGSYSEETATVYSKYQRLYVLFKSDDEKERPEKGLFVSYTAIAPGQSCSLENSLDENQNIVLKDPSGVIQTPGYPSNYHLNLIEQCYWKIFAPKGKLIKLDFKSFRLPRGTCVDIINAINKQVPMRITFCVEHPSFVVYSMNNELGIKVRDTYGRTGPGFTADYTLVTEDSSGTCKPSENSTVHMASEGMSFASPGFPQHPGYGACNWNISVPPGSFIKLTFWWVFGSCNYSYAEVYDVTNSTRVLLGKFCNILTALDDGRVVYSKGNNLLVAFVTARPASGSVQTGSFLATYQTVTAVPASYACSNPNSGGYRSKLSGSHGELASFLYPRPYANDVSCMWTIEAPVGYLIKLTFHSFDLQQSHNCSSDFVQIKEGKYYFNANELGRFCGSSLPEVIQTSQTKMYIDFKADSSGRYPGFHASYVTAENPAMGPCKTQGVDNVISLSGKTGQLFSPMYPQTFPHKMKCTWTISVPEGNYVRLRITSLFLAYICKNGTSLEIRDGQSSSSDRLKSFCGRDYDSNVFSSGRYMWVRFQSSDDQIQYGTGFNALFEAVTQLPASFSCTAPNRFTSLKSESATLASLNYPLPYDDPIECVWTINVDIDYKIVLSFDSFNLSKSADCVDDYVEVRDGLFDTSELVGKYCGAEKPSEITSDSWDLRVAFKSSGKTKYPGFKAKYETKNADNVTYILKIVGICVGALSLLCLVVSSCIACYKKTHNQGQPGMVLQGRDNTAHSDDTAKAETTGL